MWPWPTRDPARDEGVGDGGGVLHEQRRLQGEGERLDDRARDEGGVGGARLSEPLAQSRVRVLVERAARSADPVQLLGQRLQAGRLAADGAHDVQRVDVARALPDGVERGLAVEPGQAVLLDVAVAAEALQGLGHHRRGALADPELAERDAEPGEVGLARVERVREPHREDGGGLGLQGKVGEHVAHQRLVDKQRAEGAAVPGVVDGARQRASRIVAVEPSTQSSRVAPTMSMMVRTPRPSSPSRAAPRAVELDLARGVGAVAELVLEALQRERVARAVVERAGHDEAGEAAGAWASTRKTSLIGAEQNHLWPVSR